MPTIPKWAVPETIASALTTELNSLANAAYSAASAAIDNEAGLYEWMEVEYHMASITTGAGSPYAALFLVKQIDGTNYEDGGGATAPPATSQICTFPLRPSVAAAQHIIRANIPIPPCPFKLILQNVAGATLAASANTVKYRRYTEQLV